jgi:TPR repeat protein
MLNNLADQTSSHRPAPRQACQSRSVIGARLRGTLICGGALAGLFTASASGQQAGGVSERSLLPDSVLLAPQPEPDCAFKTNDPDATERQQLDYERQCYRHAEMIVRDRLQMLQDAIKERPGGPASRATTTATGGGPAPTKDFDGAQRLVEIGDRHIAQGNIAIARQYYIRAANLGLAIAAMKMAETQDPNELARWNVRGVKPDPAEAKRWYQRALELKASEAEARLRRLAGQ